MNQQGRLSGKRIILGVTGSIAAVETIRLAHALRRMGCDVVGVMSRAACEIIHPDAVTYATGNDAITTLTGRIEHVRYCGEGGLADLLLIAPCTANTLCKIASGIDDTPVTTFATTALGRGMPVVIAPAMHDTMYNHPGVKECLEKVKGWGLIIVPPRFEEGKAKMAGIEEILLTCERELLGKPLAGKKILVTSGPCQEPVDDVRVLTTRSTGRMGQEIALQALRLGAMVTVVHASELPLVTNVFVRTAADMAEAVHRVCREESPDLYISAAAISDYAPDLHPGKIKSGAPRTLKLNPLPKLIDEVLAGYQIPIVAFKHGRDESGAAREMLGRGVAMVVVNGPEVMGSSSGRVVIMGNDLEEVAEGSKRELAERIWKAILSHPTGFCQPCGPSRVDS
jgi:phosphopantothenoylcysteine decarboxylase / phosphopantothenate---cysteine ligase